MATVETRSPSVSVVEPNDAIPTVGRRRRRVVRTAALAVAGVWAVALGSFSALIYHRVDLGEDFGVYSQAWTRIGEGHLHPYSTVYGYPFLKGDFELIVWPLALLHLITTQAIVLLWVQDLAIAGCAFVTVVWAMEILEHRGVAARVSTAVGACVLIAFILNPNTYGTVAFDVHLEPVSTLFLVLAARDLWAGRTRRSWLWIAGALTCGSFAAITLTGVGLSAVLAGRATRRSGVSIIALGVVWLGLISLLHANQGSGIANYAYLAGRSTITSPSGMALVVAGIASHPWRLFDQLSRRLGDMFLLIKPVGIIGIASAWGFGVPFVVLVTNSLNGNPAFIQQSFQNFAVFPFALVGTVIVLAWLARQFPHAWIGTVVVAVVLGLVALDNGIHQSPNVVRWTAQEVGAGQSAALRTALRETPPDAEVIASMGVMGRFCQREFCYFNRPGGPQRVAARQIVFVFVPSHDPWSTPQDSAAGIAYVHDRLHARLLVATDGVTAFDWSPGPGVSSVTMPKVATPSGPP